MRVAVTGATGFVGRYVLRALERYNVDVIATTRQPKNESTSGKIDWIDIDIHNPTPDVFDRLGRPEVLIYLAWGNLPNYTSPHHFETELPAHYRFLRAAVDGGLQTLLVAGTCLEYGMQSGSLSEDMQARPSTAYGYAKNALHQQLAFLSDYTDMSLVWPRLFFVYGTGQAPSSLYSQLVKAVQHRDATFDMSGGEQLRDFSPIEDVANTLVFLALRQQNIGTINVCSGTPVSVRSLVERWIADNRWQIGINLGKYPYPTYEPMAFWGDRRKLQSILDERQKGHSQ